MKKPTIEIAEDFDFGFTFGEDNSEVLQTKNNEVEDLKKRLETLHKAILPFLDNLAKNPDKPIVWTNRAEKIDEFKKKLKKIVEG